MRCIQLRALIDQRVPHPRPRAPLPDVLGRDPRLGQPALGEQLAQPPGVLAVGLGAPLAPRNARVSTGSARCATAPAATSASHTNSQPVHASTATCISRPPNRFAHRVTWSTPAGITARCSSCLRLLHKGGGTATVENSTSNKPF